MKKGTKSVTHPQHQPQHFFISASINLFPSFSVSYLFSFTTDPRFTPAGRFPLTGTESLQSLKLYSPGSEIRPFKKASENTV